MSRTERTPEERKLFYEERFGVLNALTDVQDYDPRTDEGGNKRAMMALTDTLDDCKNLVNICGHLAGVTVRHGKVRMGQGKDAEERSVTLRDVSILSAALRNLLKRTEPDTPETINLRRALSRVTPVALFYAAIYGEYFKYRTKEYDKNNLPIWTRRERCFGGIPEKDRPVKTIEVRKDNVVDRVRKVDLGIYPENAKKIYNILKELEVKQPAVERNNGDRRIERAGEAEFFLKHLPKGLKPWTEAEQVK